MRNLIDFLGEFGDFETLFRDTELDSYIVRIYDSDGNAMYKQIVGYTEVSGDVLLHMIDAEGYDTMEELLDSIDKQGIEFMWLSKALKRGMNIYPSDQLSFDGEDDEDE